MEKKWYVVHTYSGHEKKVKRYLENAILNQGFEDRIAEVLVPIEEVVEMKRFPDNLNLKCKRCDTLIQEYKTISFGNNIEVFLICSSHECSELNDPIIAYTQAPQNKRIYSCFNCREDIEHCQVELLAHENKLLLTYYCKKCDLLRNDKIECISYNE